MMGKRVCWYFVAFFSLVVAVNAIMATLAIRTYSGTVTDHPYERGLAYNQVVEAEKKQGDLGWKGTIDYKNDTLNFTLNNTNHQPLTWEKATATITRPTQSGIDFSVELKGIETPITFPARGQWEVQIDAVVQGLHYQQSKRIIVE